MHIHNFLIRQVCEGYVWATFNMSRAIRPMSHWLRCLHLYLSCLVSVYVFPASYLFFSAAENLPRDKINESWISRPRPDQTGFSLITANWSFLSNPLSITATLGFFLTTHETKGVSFSSSFCYRLHLCCWYYAARFEKHFYHLITSQLECKELKRELKNCSKVICKSLQQFWDIFSSTVLSVREVFYSLWHPDTEPLHDFFKIYCLLYDKMISCWH